ncbi:MAG: TauD/TfdA family dioxygenase [Myxococcales bacterium]|nr:TauD/TfdA family dioxygenase [Myxococcales bacterium]
MSAAVETDYQTIQIEPLSPTVGAEIRGVRMGPDVPPEQVAEIRRALLDWKVVFFRDQDVTVAEHVAFGRHFGELEIHPFTPNREDHPEVVVIHHDEKSKRGQNQWHSDVTWRIEPSLGSILRARIVPPVGGDTLFADMFAAYDGLTDEVKEQIDGVHAIHSFEHNFGRGMTDEQREKFLEKYPRARHPVVRTHPESGHKGLYVNAAFTTHVEGFEPDESRRLLRHLYRQAAVPEYQCRFRWQKNSVAFWDNRAVQHYAAFDYHPHTRRVERVTVIGDRPF